MLRFLEGPGSICDLSALGENVGTLGGRDLAQRPPDHFLGMAQSIDGRGVDPVDAGRDRVLDGRHRIRVVLAAPPVGPSATSDGPRAEADLGDLQTACAERTFQQFHHATSLCCCAPAVSDAYALTIAEMSRSGAVVATPATISRVSDVSGAADGAADR